MMLEIKEKKQKNKNKIEQNIDDIDIGILLNLLLKKHQGVLNVGGAGLLAIIVTVGAIVWIMNTEPIRTVIMNNVDKRIAVKIAQLPTQKDIKQIKSDITENKHSIEKLREEMKQSNKEINEKLDKLLWYQLERKNRER